MSDIYSKSFFDGCVSVLQETGFPDITLADSGSLKKTELVSSVGVTGDINGYFIIQSDKENAKSFVDTLLTNMGMDLEEEFGFFTREAMGEITNQISGRSTILLSNHGIDCDITPPTVMTGVNLISTVNNTEVNKTKFIQGSFGIISVYVGVKIIKNTENAS